MMDQFSIVIEYGDVCDQSIYTCAGVLLYWCDVVWSIGSGRLLDSPVQGRGVNLCVRFFVFEC